MRSLIPLLLLGTIPTAIYSQDPPTKLQDLGVACCTLRVWAIDGQAQGKFQGLLPPASLMLSPCKGSLCPTAGGSDSTIVLKRSTAVEVYAGRSVEKGVKWGAAIGALALTAYWMGREDIEQEQAGKIGAGLVLGGVVGAVAGGLIGALFPRWLPIGR